MPDEKLGWKPHEKSMSLGQLATHVATLPGGLAQILMNDSFDIAGARPSGEATSSAELVSSLKESVLTARRLIGSLDDRKAMSNWKMVNGGKDILVMPRIAMIRYVMLNHWYHHRGQLSVYLRLLNVPIPSIYGPSADENPFK
ncbi:MAG: damage-inducible protein DinB [Acidobacteria bacterium]|nr:damage-inducible protein DinB [Acidobacteriota bacterium]